MSWWRKFISKARGAPHPLAPKFDDGCDHHPEAIHLRQGTPEFEEFVARGELEMRRDLGHGAGHLASLLWYDPARPEWVGLLEEYLAAAGADPEALIPRVEPLYAATEAVRAYLWRKQGRLADAVGLLVDVVEAKNEARYLDAWGLDWLEAPGAVESLSERLGVRLFASVWSRSPEARHSTLPRLRQLGRWAALVERFAEAHPITGQAVMIRAGLLRKAGRLDEAAAVARAALEQSPDWSSASALGLALREKGDCQGAEEAFRRALELDPSDNSARLEAGDMFLDRQEWKRALDWYQGALAREAGQPWALASASYCRWKLSGDKQLPKLFLNLVEGENARARMLYHRALGGGLPEPVDATANVLRKVRETILAEPEQLREGGSVTMRLSNLEAPSNLLAFRLDLEALGRDLTLNLAVKNIPTPDPREPIGPVTYRLWTYDGSDATSGLPPPGDDVTRQIAELASEPYDEQANWASASRVAESLGPARVGEVLATMVHPPAIPEGSEALAWLPRVQLAAAQVAAQVDQGWEGSARREALLSVVLGPRDWATEAAIRVLARLAHDEESLAYDIHQAFERLERHRPDAGYWCWETTLYQCWLTLPLLVPSEREEMQRKLREVEENDEAQRRH